MRNSNLLKSGFIILVALALGFYNLPSEQQKSIFPFLPSNFYEQKINLGLDLQGGSQLDYKIDLRKVPEQDKGTIVEGILNVITKRVNGLGVSEPNIYASQVGDESHIIVELAGIKDLDQAKDTVGKTIQLEFKERKEEADPEHKAKIKDQSEQALVKAKENQDFKIFGESEEQANPGKVVYTESSDWQTIDELPSGLKTALEGMEVGQIYDGALETSGEYVLDSQQGGLLQKSGYNVIKLLDKQSVDQTVDEPKQVKAAQILISFKDASGADESITRTEEEAKTRAEEVLSKLNETGENNTFENLVKEYSDDSSTKDNGGLKDEYLTTESNETQEYLTAALALEKGGDLSSIVKSPLGFHIIKAMDVKEPATVTTQRTEVKIARIFYDSVDDMWKDTGLNGQYFQRANIDFNDLLQPHVVITFNPEGAVKFEELTGRNVNKPIAIFVGGQLISAPNVNEKISGGNAIISGQFSVKEAEELARDLNTGAIPAPILLVGQYNIGASLGQDALNRSLNAGLIGLALIALFMILYYRWAGLVASVALGFYTVTLLFLIKAQIPMAAALAISLFIFGYLIFNILNSNESGPEKLIAFILTCFVLFFLSFLLATPVVLTLAGVAGVILSIGMAVDANILIFERIKEELRDGRPKDSAITVGFERAWSSIKDSNFSSLITCGILFYFGSSIIQGFAFNLAAGILVSMFSAITITRVLLKTMLNTPFGKKKSFFGIPKKLTSNLLPITTNRKLYYGLSAVLIAASLFSLAFFGLKPSLDFTGGSLMELKFETPVSSEELKTSINDVVSQINTEKNEALTNGNVKLIDTSSTESEEPTLVQAYEELDLGTIQVVTSGDNLLVKSRDMSAADHDLLLEKLEAKYGTIEETRFQSVGPTIGESLRNKAFYAVLIAILAIILYIAFAFRKVPESVGKWKFGIAALVALVHDIILLMGIYVFLGVVLGLEIDALFITAILTIMGFSVHDTIVVLDRLREKLIHPNKDKTFTEITNEAVNETLTRSINTSLTAALALFMLAFYGSESIKGFNLALLIGIIVGTYSSIFIASPVLVDWYNFSQKEK